MKTLFGGSPLFRKITISILLASVFFMSLLNLVVYYSNEILEDALLAKQTEFELQNTRQLLAENPDAMLPRTASLSIYLASRQTEQLIPAYLVELGDGVHHDLKIDDKAYHILVAPHGDDRIYIQSDVTEIERSEDLLSVILLIAWIVLIVSVFFIARLLSRKLAGPISQLSQDLSNINPDERGIQLSDRFADDEVGSIARAFDTYTRKMDSYVEKQSAFAAMASHELRSPLTIVQTSADLISMRQHNSDIDPYLEKIQRASSNMAHMIHALLAVTRDQPTETTRESVALHPLVDEILESMQPEIDTKQIEIENNLASGTSIDADRTLVMVVITNLVRNAVKHGQQSVIRITMEHSALSISDSGIGLDSQALQRIFDFGYRGQNSQGYGIGLYISKLICDHQGWSLDLASNPEGGVIAKVDFTN
jgi:signal transduction histidine kinase